MHWPLITLGIMLIHSAAVSAADLYATAGAGNLAQVEAILAQGGNADAPGRNDETPLMAAALADQPKIAEILLAHGADILARNAGGFTPLHAAAYSGSMSAALLLLDKGALLEDTNNKAHASPLMVAADEGHADVVELFIARGADLNSLDKEGFSPLSQAWSKKHMDVVRLLKQHGATCQPVEVLGGDNYYQSCVKAGQ